MTCGIYQIVNNINGKGYVGQSKNIERRWIAHKESKKDYPLYKAFKKYGIENFTFKIIEECNSNELNEKEKYYIQKENSEYNQTEGGDYQAVPQKLENEAWKEIQNILIQDKEGTVSHKELAKKYNVHKDTIRDINVGRIWYDSNLSYPLHYSKFDPNNPKKGQDLICPVCGKTKSKKAKVCRDCYNKPFIEKSIEKEKEKQRRIEEIKKKKSLIDQKQQEKDRLKYQQIDKNGKVINTFKSIADAARYLVDNNLASSKSESGIRSHISAVTKGKRKTAYGFYWKYLEK